MRERRDPAIALRPKISGRTLGVEWGCSGIFGTLDHRQVAHVAADADLST